MIDLHCRHLEIVLAFRNWGLDKAQQNTGVTSHVSLRTMNVPLNILMQMNVTVADLIVGAGLLCFGTKPCPE